MNVSFSFIASLFKSRHSIQGKYYIVWNKSRSKTNCGLVSESYPRISTTCNTIIQLTARLNIHTLADIIRLFKQVYTHTCVSAEPTHTYIIKFVWTFFIAFSTGFGFQVREHQTIPKGMSEIHAKQWKGKEDKTPPSGTHPFGDQKKYTHTSALFPILIIILFAFVLFSSFFRLFANFFATRFSRDLSRLRQSRRCEGAALWPRVENVNAFALYRVLYMRIRD